MMPRQYPRSGGVSPVPSPLRSTKNQLRMSEAQWGYRAEGLISVRPSARPIQDLGGGDASSVEPGGAPLGVRPTSLGLAVAGVLAALAFCLAVWGTLWLLGSGYFITALVGVTVAYIATAIFRKK